MASKMRVTSGASREAVLALFGHAFGSSLSCRVQQCQNEVIITNRSCRILPPHVLQLKPISGSRNGQYAWCTDAEIALMLE